MKHFANPVIGRNIYTNKQLANDFLRHFPDKTTLIYYNLTPQPPLLNERGSIRPLTPPLIKERGLGG
jgi:hypothetical protein